MSLTVNGQAVGVRPFIRHIKRARSKDTLQNPFGLTHEAYTALRDMAGDDYDPDAPSIQGTTIHLPASAIAAQLPDNIPSPDPMAEFDRLKRLKATEPIEPT